MTLAPAIALSSSSSAASAAAAPDPIWKSTSARPSPGATLHPSAFKAYSLNASAMAAKLAKAPSEDAADAVAARVQLPAPNGELVDFDVVQTQLMEPGLAAKHPEIETYAGKAANSNAAVVIDVSPYGFHAAVRGSGASWFIDPATINDPSLYLSYRGSDLPAPEKRFTEPELDDDTVAAVKSAGLGEPPDGVVSRRTYRLAFLTDPTYAEYVAPGMNDGAHDAESNNMVMAAKTTLMNRVNEIYTNDLAVRMVFVADTDKLNFNTMAKATGANGPCGANQCFTAANLDPANGCLGSLLSRNRLVVGQLIGAENFDIGHIGLGINGGGIASLGVVGGNNKAQGCTGLPDPIGDFYAIDYVAHEMGHQFSGNHTFNGTQVNCSSSNRNAANSVEPGSGSSVMAYAGICRNDDLQPHTDPYFSQRSQTEISTYLQATLANIAEVQSVAFNGAPNAFDGTDSFTLTFPGIGTTGAITRGTNYSAAGIKSAIETLFSSVPAWTGTVATVAGYFGGTFGDSGFQVTYNTNATPSATQVNVPNPTLNPTGFTGFVSDIAKGGPADNNGAQDQPVTNHAPVVTAPPGKFIPTQTPFTLTGVGTDSDNDTLIYLWEQNDVGASGNAGGTGLTTQPKLNGPLFRVFGHYANVTDAGTLQYHSPGENLATTSPSRTFPDMDQILNGWTNAATGSCPVPQATDYENDTPIVMVGGQPVANTLKDGPVLECYSEFLPTAAYTGTAAAANLEPSLNFRLTARDQNPTAGGYQYADTKLRIDKTAGPFLVTSQATSTTYDAASMQTITWDVNGTNKPTLAPNVKISFSADGGQTFDRVLAASTPNDGSESVKIPSVDTTEGRIKIEAVDNYFFDVNDAPVTVEINDTTKPQTSITGLADRSYLLATSVTLGLHANESPATFACTLDGAALACPGSSVTLSNLAPGTHTFTATATDNVGNTDASPAVVHFTVPVDDAALVATKGKWQRQSDGAAYLGTVSVAKKKGSTLSTTISGAKQVALVVSTGKKLGEVKVKLNGHTLTTISLKGPASHQATVLVSGFDAPATGTLTLVTASKKKVKIDGLLVVTAP